MLRRPRSDFWQVGIVPLPVEQIDAAALAAARDRITWLPNAGPWRYLADPFGLVRGDVLHVFVEAFDYRTKRACIERHAFSRSDMAWRDRAVVLDRPFHLSYPQVFEHEGETWMVPESYQADEIALYRATDDSLNVWERECALLGGIPGADASLVEHDGRWWMFYTLVGPGGRDQRELHIAHSPALAGPWTPLASNPVRVNRNGARPAGRPFVGRDGVLTLPVQDSSSGYGGATRLLRFPLLTPDWVSVEACDERLTGDLVSSSHTAGLHTLSACGELTLIDVKRVDRSRGRQWLDFKRRLRRLVSA
ncbi:MAG: glycosyl hydrolase family 43 [Burkholderiales bacterium]|nr:MAG: glycosyl hydrolase family 43 [Burkholderiales bacterium]